YLSATADAALRVGTLVTIQPTVSPSWRSRQQPKKQNCPTHLMAPDAAVVAIASVPIPKIATSISEMTGH
ncbi:MAG: hypothetical protein O7I42_08565, partial [Alphaproteobacteria bacterium]|nr:hypothetical protein [Alphaproteobacteria bacterium]